MTTPAEELSCLHGPEGCTGTVKPREPLSGTGKSFDWCDGHWAKRLDIQERVRRDYPDSPVAPAWFDPANAGERWDDDY
jgi:hypothetical protein